MSVSRDGQVAYVANGLDDTVSVVETAGTGMSRPSHWGLVPSSA